MAVNDKIIFCSSFLKSVKKFWVEAMPVGGLDATPKLKKYHLKKNLRFIVD
jgi:hypothetical protein